MFVKFDKHFDSNDDQFLIQKTKLRLKFIVKLLETERYNAQFYFLKRVILNEKIYL